MKYDLDTLIDRRSTDSSKWGWPDWGLDRERLLPMGLADMISRCQSL